LNNLHFWGSKVPSASAAKDTVSELILSLQREGANPDFILDRALAYTEQMDILERKGLIQPITKAPKKTSNTALIKNHKKRVAKHVQQEAVDEVEVELPPRADSEEVITGTPEGAGPSLGGNPLPPGSPVDEVIALDEGLNDANALQEHHQHELAAANQQLLNQQSADKLRILQLEHQLSIANGALVEDVNKNFNELMSAQLATLKQELVSQFSLDIRAETAIMKNELLKIDAIKSSVEASHEHCCSMSDLLNEILGSVNMNGDRLDILNKDVAAIALVRAAVSSNSALLQELLKVKAKSSTPLIGMRPALLPVSAATLPPSPSLSCRDCGGSHNPRECPRSDFCVRCLKMHKHWDCPSLREICPVCREAGLGNLAYGHTRDVHAVTDLQMREKICNILPKMCFRQWTTLKRKLPL